MTTAYRYDAMSKICRLRDNLIVWVPDAECQLVVSQPLVDPTLWNEYLQGAFTSYSKHGVECVLDLDSIKDGNDTQLFYAAVNTDGHVVGGARVIGPLQSPDDSHAMIEWAGNPGVHTMRKMINDRLPFGVVEVKTAWADNNSRSSGSITTALARIPSSIMALLEVRFVMATAAAHVLDRWRSSGGLVADNIPPAAYPNHHYQTKMMWWDRSTFARHAEPKQLSKMLVETRALMHDYRPLSNTPLALAGSGR
ncbi:hypothetical protein B1987_13055 [Mycobacterium kansasii]|nr:hypothetical protein B1987_13055 [Mycobacterium kansasii]